MQRYRVVGAFSPDPNGKWCKVEEIPPVPEPLPWLDQPDGEGAWLYIPDAIPNEWEVFRLFWDGSDGCYYRHKGQILSVMFFASGLWQRIPQPTLPGEDST